MTDSPHVVMIVANDVTADTRVKRMAVSLAGSGLRVTVVGLSTTGKRTEGAIGKAQIIRVPVLFALRDQRRRLPLPSLGYRSKQEYVAARRRLKVVEREVAASVGRKFAVIVDKGLADADDPIAKAHRYALRLGIKARRGVLKPRRKVARLREAFYRRHLANSSGSLDPLLFRVNRWLPSFSPLWGWRRVLPEIDDYELAFGPVLDELEPDVIHAHDVPVIGIAERAAARARARGRRTRWVYDAHEYVPGWPQYPVRKLSAYIDLEREYIRRADRVITVSEPIAEELQRSFSLVRRPTVIMNIPVVVSDLPPEERPSVRTAAGLGDEVPLLVYSGRIDPTRGVQTLVDALPLLPDVHIALVSKATSSYVQSLERRADALGCRERLHLVPFVEPHEVAAYLSCASAGVHTLPHCGNHEVALPNKYFEYLHARLPIIVSDVKAMADLTRELGIGEVFEAENPESLAVAVRRVLADRERYTRPLQERPEILERFSWPREEQKLIRVYRDLLGEPTQAAGEADPIRTLVEIGRPERGRAVLGIGPRNTAGQAWAWARALERFDGVSTEVFALERNSPLVYPTDVRIPARSWKDLDWQFMQVRHVLGAFTHLLLESGSGIFGTLNGGFFAGDLPALRARGIEVGLVFHGSEIRDPRLHRKLEQHSPFADEQLEFALRMQDAVDQLLALVERFDGPCFVTTLDLLDYVPDAKWLPVVVDLSTWQPGPPPLQRDRPVVVHAPSHDVLKGSALVDVVAEELDGQGLIEYRRLRNLPVEAMPQVLRDADIVLDQFALGDYGVLACQAMASGRVVIGHVSDRVRERLREPLPMVEATTENIRDVLLQVLQDRAWFRTVAAEGIEYVREYHDGRLAARRLQAFLGLEEGTG